MSTRSPLAKVLAPVALALLASFGMATAAQAQQAGATTQVRSVRRLGNPSTRFVAPVRTIEALGRSMARPAIQRDLTTVLTTAGITSTSVQDEVKKILAGGSVRQTTLAPGTRLEWMALRRNGRPNIIGNIQWAGTAPLAGYEFVVDDMTNTYTFFVPEICGNVSLVSREPSREAARQQAAQQAAAQAEAARQAEVAKAAAAKAAAEKAAVAKAAAEKAAAEKAAAEKAEAARQAAAAEAARRAEEARAAEAARIAAEDRDLRVRPFFTGLFGRRKGLPSEPDVCGRCFDAGVATGVALKINDKAAFAPSVGVAFNLGDSGRSAVVVDAPIHYLFNNGGYFGGGLTVWDLFHGDNANPGFVIGGGVPVAGGPRQAQLMAVFEWRQLFLEKKDPADVNRQGWVGLKYLFK